MTLDRRRIGVALVAIGAALAAPSAAVFDAGYSALALGLVATALLLVIAGLHTMRDVASSRSERGAPERFRNH